MNSDQNLLPAPRQENVDLPHKVTGVTLAYGIAQQLRKSQVYILWAIFGVTVFLRCLTQSMDGWNPSFTVGEGNFERIWQVRHLIYVFGPLLFGRLADVYSRPISLALALVFYILGCIISATSSNAVSSEVGLIFHTIGLAGIALLATLFIADHTPLKWRGLGLSWTYAVSLAVLWLMPELYFAVEWKWIYGMAAIMVFALCVPAVFLLFSAARKHRALTPNSQPIRAKDVASQLDLVGLAIFTLGFGLISFGTTTMVTRRERFEKYPPGRTAMLVIGLLLAFPVFVCWEYSYASFPLMPRRVLLHRKGVLLPMLVIFLFQFLTAFPLGALSYIDPVGGTISDVGYLYSASDIAYYASAPILGVVFYVTRRSKPLLIVGNIIFVVGCVLWLYATLRWGPSLDLEVPASKVYLYISQVFIGLGSIAVEMSIMIGAQASVTHDDLAIATALIVAWSGVSGVLGSSAATAIELRQDSDRTKLLTFLGLTLGLSLPCILLSLFVPNFVLADKQNAVEGELDSRGDK